jgi:hypothetical protein
MFSELIYTRCRQGVDILRDGKPITSDGFKVYSCTKDLMENSNADLQFLFNAAQGKQAYHDPDFMDDAYLYLVPDKGDSFMIEFHPVPFDANATGDYSHRSGNFVNHILVCNFSDFYPFELFRDKDVWNAKIRGEAYYYENTPDTLPVHSEVNDPAGEIHRDEIASFIADGRGEALKKAVSFLIAQYELPPEDRKYLVIHDESSEKIEKWVAAIECAFSPRMATTLPFATRMEKFTTANRYTIDLSGAFQTQINLQDPNQKQRYRAMIVGVDERDKVNVSAARPLANSPFVLLDGIEKKAMFEAKISHPYYDFITSFDDSHATFCREFVQMMDIKKPYANILSLFDVYATLEKADVLPNAEKVANALSVLNKYKILFPSRLKTIYIRVFKELQRFLQERPLSALQIIKWLQSVSPAIGNNKATQQLSETVCKAFADQVYKKSDAEGAFSFWESVKNSEFASGVAKYFVEPATIKSHSADLQQFKKSDTITFVLIYLKCAAFLGTVNVQNLNNIVKSGLQSCARENDIGNAHKILNELPPNNVQNMLFAILREPDQKYEEFIVKLLIESNATIDTNDSSMFEFIKKLGTEKLDHLFVPVLKRRINNLKRAADIEQFINVLIKIKPIANDDLVKIYQALDGKLIVNEKGSTKVASTIQEKKPQGAVCVKSAHIYALDVLTDKQQRAQIKTIYHKLETQGFPSEKDHEYIQDLIEKLFKAPLTQEELIYFIKLFARVAEYITEFVNAILEITTPKNIGEWNILIDVVMETKNKATYDAIVSDCAKLKHGEKALNQLHEMLDSEERRTFFMQIKDEALEIIRSKKQKSLWGKLFAKPNEDDSGSKKK